MTFASVFLNQATAGWAANRLDDSVRELSSKKFGRGCRVGAVAFVVGVRTPTAGGARVEEVAIMELTAVAS
jgi:hypothetical protein